MLKLWLNFIDEYGEERRVAVEKNYFVIGRSPENDLCFPDKRLSRQHLEIACYGDEFYVTECGSSNGTTVNGVALADSAPVKNGDVLNLGGGLEIRVEIISAEQPTPAASLPPEPAVEGSGEISANAPEASLPPVTAQASGNGGGIPISFFIIAPVLGLMFLAMAGGLLFLFSGTQGKEVAQNRRNDDFIYADDDDDPPTDNRNAKDPDATPTPKTESGSSNNNAAPDSSPLPRGESSPAPNASPVSSENDRVERSALSFMRRIAQNDPNPVLTGKQVEIIGAKIKSLKSAPALRDNLQAVKKNAAQFESLAQSKNLKPQMLATAGLAKLGTTRGDPLAAAQGMTDILQKLSIHVGTEFADDNLIVIAAFDQGQNNQFLKMRDTMAATTRQFPEASSRSIRTIWFLREKGKLTEAEFEFALRFLAIGAIAQNPKDFGVETEAINFN
jgi:pSer/pThr/pTyr-binding forkhead associated (FHA) protein